MSLPVQLALAALAGWRVTHLLASEDGPADLIYRLRAWLGTSFPGKLMDCFYCLSLWVAAPLAWFVAHRVVDGVLTWLALSGAICLLERLTRETPELPKFHYEGEITHVLRPEKGQPQD